jgi:transposase
MRLSESLKAPAFAERLVLYESLPGTGLITAATLIAEIGDITRFTHAGEVAAYAGLDPRVFQSADSCRHGRISKNGPHDLRWVLQQAAWTAIRCDTRCRAIYERIRLRAGKKKAATAVARHLIVWVWAMTRRNALYNPRQSAAA